jgi:hypothetical protein
MGGLKIHWPSFWHGFQTALASPVYATIAFAGVFRRVWKDDCPAVFYDARSMWRTRDEQEARSRAAFDKIIRETDQSLS